MSEKPVSDASKTRHESKPWDEHTPTPWLAEGELVYKAGTLLLIADCEQYEQGSVEEGAANAALIARAVNSFDSLLEACKAALDEMTHLEEHDQLQYFDTDILRAAIQNAEKQP